MTAAEALRIECSSCGASSEIEPRLRTATCPWCASPQVLETSGGFRSDRPRPAFTLGFTLPREQAMERAREWRRRKARWAPRAFSRAPLREVRGVYVPAYLYSAVAHVRFHAEIGEEYQTGKNNEDTRTEWLPLSGEWHGWVRERVVSASRGVPNEALEGVEPYDFGPLHRYTPKLVSGWIAENPSRERSECLRLGRAEARAEVEERLRAFLPGDDSRNLRLAVRLEREDLELALLPAWLLAVRSSPDAEPVRILVNGQTGRVHGKPPLSWAKVVLAVAAGLALVGAGLALAWLFARAG